MDDLDKVPLGILYASMIGPVLYLYSVTSMFYLGLCYAIKFPLRQLMSRRRRQQMAWARRIARLGLVLSVADALGLAYVYGWAWPWWVVVVTIGLIGFFGLDLPFHRLVALHEAIEEDTCTAGQLRRLLLLADFYQEAVRGKASDNMLLLRVGPYIYSLTPHGATAAELAELVPKPPRRSAGDGVTRLIVRRRGRRRTPNRPND